MQTLTIFSFNGLGPPVRTLKAPAIDVAFQRVSGGAQGGRKRVRNIHDWVLAGPNCCHMNGLVIKEIR